jgi:uncharacterized protein (TIRG00374 family)
VTPPERRSTRALQLTIGLGISAVLVWLSFRKVDFGGAWQAIRTVHVWSLLAAVFLATLSFPLRIPRWRLLLRRADDSAVDRLSLWHALAIGFAANNVLLFRAGEVLRVAAVNRVGKVSFAAALSSVAVERVLDALTVVALLGFGLITAHLPADVRIGNGPPIATIAADTGIVCLAALAVAILAAWRRDLALRVFERLLPSGSFSAKIVRFADNVLRGLGAMRDWRRAGPVVFWSFVIWLVNAAGFFMAFRAFNFDVPFTGALILQGALMLAIAAPSTPGYVGIMEPVIIASLALFGISNTAAGAYAIAYHATTFVPITVLGAYSAFRTGVRLKVPPPATP